jgi:hypothetical protein
MWISDKAYPLASFTEALHTTLGSLLLFAASGCLAGIVMIFNPQEPESLVPALFVWVFAAIGSAIALFGIPFFLVHFWTLYHLLFTEESRWRLFCIAFATHAGLILVSMWLADFSQNWLRGLIGIGIICSPGFVLNKYGAFASKPADNLARKKPYLSRTEIPRGGDRIALCSGGHLLWEEWE